MESHLFSTEGILKWSPEAESAVYWWSTDPNVKNWLNASGERVPFSPDAPVLFDGSERSGGKIQVGDGVNPGDIHFLSPFDYTLTGKKLGGSGTFIKGGSGTLTLEGSEAGFNGHAISVTNGILKLGTGLPVDALGNSSEPIRVSGRGAVDINFMGAFDDPSRNNLTRQKSFEIEGAGPDGKGALVNRGKDWSLASFSRIQLTGDAAVGGRNRFGIQPLEQGQRPVLEGPGHTLTVKDGVCFSVFDCDGNLKRVSVTEGAKFLFGGSSHFTLPEGVELDGGEIDTWQAKKIDFPVRTLSGNNLIDVQKDVSEFSGPVTVSPDTVLEIKGESIFSGAITNQGTLRLTGGSPNMKGNIWSDTPIEINKAWPVWGLGCSSQGDLELDGKAGGLIYRTKGIGGCFTLTNTAVEFPAGQVQIGGAGIYGHIVWGSGCRFNVHDILLGTGWEKSFSESTQLEVGPDVEIKTANIEIGAWNSDSYPRQHELSINGGDCVVSGSCAVASKTAYGSLFLNGGRLATPGLSLRSLFPAPLNEYNTGEYVVMSGGLLELGAGGFTTGRRLSPSNDSGIYLNGGVVSNTASMAVDNYSNITFAGSPVIWDIGTNSISFNSALQGDGDVTIRGDGVFSSGTEPGKEERDSCNRINGTVRGHWTIANKGVTKLFNAAAFTRGLTLEPEVWTEINIRDTGHLRFGTFHTGPAFFINKLYQQLPFGVPTYLDGETARVHRIGRAGERYFYTGEFYVSAEQEGTWTFAECYDKEAYLLVDGQFVFNNITWPASVGHIDLTKGWHSFRLALYNQWGGPCSWGNWKANGIGIGWAAQKTTSTDATSYTRFSPDKLPMRPGVTPYDRMRLAGNSVLWSRVSGTPANWSGLESWHSVSVTNSLKMVTDRAWKEAPNAVNRLSGWFHVEPDQAGTWDFWGSYDSACILRIDGFDAGLDGSAQKYSQRSFNLAAGWHRFEILTRGAQNGPSSSDIGFKYRINASEWTSFDEDTLKLKACLTDPNTEYGFIGGRLELKSGSVLVNRSEDIPCSIQGTLAGEGTLKGCFAFSTNGVWEIEGNGTTIRPAHFEDEEGYPTYPKTLSDLRHIRLIFSTYPTVRVYDLSEPLGLEEGLEAGEGELPAIKVVATDVTGEKRYPFKAALRNNRVVLLNLAPPGTLLVLE